MKLIGEDEDTHYIDDLRALKDALRHFPPVILSFDESIFSTIVERIKAGVNGAMTFVLKGGLNLTESRGAEK